MLMRWRGVPKAVLLSLTALEVVDGRDHGVVTTGAGMWSGRAEAHYSTLGQLALVGHVRAILLCTTISTFKAITIRHRLIQDYVIWFPCNKWFPNEVLSL